MKRYRHAFTLVELLVVVAILALLVSILVPSLQKARELARAAVCRSQIGNLGSALYLYVEAWGGWVPPPCVKVDRGTVDAYGNPYYAWPTWNQHLIAQQINYWQPTQDYIGNIRLCYCANDKIVDPSRGSYGMNGRMGGGDEIASQGGSPTWTDRGYYNTRRTFRPAEMYMLAETQRTLPYGGSYAFVGPAGLGYRHNKRCSLLYQDNHVEMRTYEGIQEEYPYSYRDDANGIPAQGAYHALPFFNRTFHK